MRIKERNICREKKGNTPQPYENGRILVERSGLLVGLLTVLILLSLWPEKKSLKIPTGRQGWSWCV